MDSRTELRRYLQIRFYNRYGKPISQALSGYSTNFTLAALAEHAANAVASAPESTIRLELNIVRQPVMVDTCRNVYKIGEPQEDAPCFLAYINGRIFSKKQLEQAGLSQAELTQILEVMQTEEADSAILPIGEPLSAQNLQPYDGDRMANFIRSTIGD